MTFGEKIAELRTQKGWRQEDLASQLFVTKQAVSKWENDKDFPDIGLIKKISEIFNVSTDYLLGITNIPDIDIEKREYEKILDSDEEVIIAERSNVGIIDLFIVAMVFGVLLLSSILSEYSMGAINYILVTCTVLTAVIALIIFLFTPRLPIIKKGRKLLLYRCGKKNIKTLDFDNIKEVATNKEPERYKTGLVKIITKDDKEYSYFFVKRPNIVKEKIDTLLNSMTND